MVLSYEVLDRVADSYAPCLGVVWLALIGKALLARACQVAATRFVLGASMLAVAYGFMWLNSTTGAWHALGLDYNSLLSARP